MKSIAKFAAALAAGTSLLVPVFVFAHDGEDHSIAQVGVNAAGSAQVTPTSAGINLRAKVTASTTADTTRAERAKDKAAQEIDRRVASLNQLLTRITAMKKVSADLKATLKQNVDNQVNGFVALKAKIEADTDLSVLKTDVQSVTQSYRLYILVMPQVRITAAADRMVTIINMMAEVGAKLQARVQNEKTAGKDTAALEALLGDLGSKLTSAQAHAEAAVTSIAPLVPDQGDKTVQATNEAAIKKSQGELKSGHEDIVAARKDIANIISGLAKLGVSAGASGTVHTQ
jgi:hypothetical protein